MITNKRILFISFVWAIIAAGLFLNVFTFININMNGGVTYYEPNPLILYIETVTSFVGLFAVVIYFIQVAKAEMKGNI